ncbi:hypothetical protein [Pseudonocardia sp. DLS-67]
MGLTIVVVLVVLAVIAAVAFLAVQGRRRRQDQQRIEAAEHRHEAEIRTASAQRREAEAAEAAARGKQDREVAQARQAAADRVDPDRSRRDGPTDPAARTDDLRTPAAADHDRPPADQREPQPPGDPEFAGRGRHAGPPPHEQGPAADSAGSTDDLRIGQENSGRNEPPGAPDQPDGDPLSRAWHGPTATGGSVGRDRGSRHAEATGPDDAQADVPAQRTGEHERHGVRALADRIRGRHG